MQWIPVDLANVTFRKRYKTTPLILHRTRKTSSVIIVNRNLERVPRE